MDKTLITARTSMLLVFIFYIHGCGALKTMMSQRMRTVEKKLDILSSEVGSFRYEIWELLESIKLMNETQTLHRETIADPKCANDCEDNGADKDQMEPRQTAVYGLYNAFKEEKAFVRNLLKGLDDQIYEKLPLAITNVQEKVASHDNVLATSIEPTLGELERRMAGFEALTNTFKTETESIKSDIQHLTDTLSQHSETLQKISKEQADTISRWISVLDRMTAIKNGQECQRGWTFYNYSCYKRFSTALNWDNAQSECEKHFAYLAEIQDEEEKETLHELIKDKGYHWIGATDRQTEGSWVWANSGTKMTYSNWATSQPDNHRDNEDCLMIYPFSKWNDLRCASKVAFVCEMTSL